MPLSALFRVGKRGTKFDAQLCSVEAMHSAIEGKLVTLRWVRGSKCGAARKNVLATPDGRAMWPAADALDLTVTLYRAEAGGAFDGKEIKIALDEVVRAGATKTLATARIDLAKFADKSGAMALDECELTLLGEDGRKGRIKLTVAIAPEGALTRTTSDRRQVTVEKETAHLPDDRPAHEQAGRSKPGLLLPGPPDQARKARGATEGAGSKGSGKMAARERRALGLATDSQGDSEESQDGKHATKGTLQEERRAAGQHAPQELGQPATSRRSKRAEAKGQEDTQGPSREERQAGGKEQRPTRGVAASHKAARPQLEEPTADHASPLPSFRPVSKSGHQPGDTESKSDGLASGGREGRAASVSGHEGGGSRDPRGRGADGASSAHDTEKQSKRHADGSPRRASPRHPQASPRRHQPSADGQGGAGLGRPGASRTPGPLRPPAHLSDDSDADAQLASPGSRDEKVATRKRVVRIGPPNGALASADGAHAPRVHCAGMGSGVRERGVSSIQRHLREEVATCIAVAAEAVRQQELVVSKMALQVEKTERIADVSLLLEAAIFCFPLPAVPVDAGRSNGSKSMASDLPHRHADRAAPTVYLCVWLVTKCMRHWGLMDVVSVGETAGTQEPHKTATKALGDCDCEWGASNEPYFFCKKLVDALETMVRGCEASGRVARCLISNLVILDGILHQQVATAAQVVTSSRRNDDDAGGRTGADKRRAGGGGTAEARATRARAAMLAQLHEEVHRQALVLLRRLVQHECSQIEAIALQVAVLCSARQGAPPDSQALLVAQEPLQKLAATLAADRVLPCVRRAVAKGVMAALDAALLDSMLRYGLVSSFDAALECKNVVARVEAWAICLGTVTGRLDEQRCAHTLSGDFGFSWPHGAQNAAGTNGALASDAAGGMSGLKLKLARQAADLIMMEKFMLVGPSAQEWRRQICPALSCRQIERLVVNFTPCASAPEAVAPEVLRDLALQASKEEGELYALPQLFDSLHQHILDGVVPDVEDLQQAAFDLSQQPAPTSIPASLRGHPRFPFLLSEL